jgi:hypothetical protein
VDAIPASGTGAVPAPRPASPRATASNDVDGGSHVKLSQRQTDAAQSPTRRNAASVDRRLAGPFLLLVGRAPLAFGFLILALVWVPGLLLFGTEDIERVINVVITIALWWIWLRGSRLRRPALELERGALVVLACRGGRAARRSWRRT